MKLEEELLQYLAYNTNQITRCSAQNVLRGSSVVRHRRSGQTCLLETLRTLLFLKSLNSLHPALVSCKMKRGMTQLFQNKQRKKIKITKKNGFVSVLFKKSNEFSQTRTQFLEVIDIKRSTGGRESLRAAPIKRSVVRKPVCLSPPGPESTGTGVQEGHCQLALHPSPPPYTPSSPNTHTQTHTKL